MGEIRKPQRLPGEGQGEYFERVAEWESMTWLAAQVKAARSRLGTALEDSTGYVDDAPADQQSLVARWVKALEDAYRILEPLDLDGWKPAVAARAEQAAPK